LEEEEEEEEEEDYWIRNLVLSIGSQTQTTKFVKETADIPKIQETSNVEITNEDNAHHFFQYQGCYCSLRIRPTRSFSQPNLLCENTEEVT
jgi:hypothetical protein